MPAAGSCDLAVQGQDQLPQAGQAGPVQQQQGGLHGRLRVQPVHQPQAGVPRGGVPAQGQPQAEPGLVVVREGGHRGQAVGAPGQGHQQRGQEHGQGVTHAPPVARIGQLGQLVGEGAQGLQEGGVVACDNVFHEGRRESFEDVGYPLGCTTALFVAQGMVPAADTDYPYRINPKMRWIGSMPMGRGPPPEPIADSPDSPPSRDFAFTLSD